MFPLVQTHHSAVLRMAMKYLEYALKPLRQARKEGREAFPFVLSITQCR